MSAWTAEQVPPSQTPSGQTVPQPPQLFGSLLRSAHRSTHSTKGSTQPRLTWARAQVPPSQAPSQTVPHAPQLFGSLERSTQTPPQLVSVSTQAIGGPLQIPPSQTSSGQTLPQAPQLSGSIDQVDTNPTAVGFGQHTGDRRPTTDPALTDTVRADGATRAAVVRVVGEVDAATPPQLVLGQHTGDIERIG